MIKRIINYWFKPHLLNDAPRVNVQVKEDKKRKGLSVSASSLRASQVGATAAFDSAYTIPKPPPGVVPEGHVIMAMDDAAISTNAWAMDSIFQEGLGFLGYPYLAELAQRPEYRRISEIVAKEMTRKWIKLQSVGEEVDNTEKLKQIESAMKRLKVRESFRRAAELDGFFGRAHIYIDLNTGDNSDELQTPIGEGTALTKVKVRKGSLKALRVIEPVWTYPNAYNANDPLRSDYFKPTSWFVQGRLLHASRLLTFVGREVSDLLKPAYSFGGLALSQMAKPYVDNWLRTRQSVSDLLHSFSVFVLKTDMSGALAGDEDGGGIFERAQLFNQMRDNRGIMMLNKDTEEFQNVSASLGSLDRLQAQSQEHMSAVSGIPLVKLLGITPSGLNASSDGEMRSFYDWIEAQQEALFNDNLSKILNIVQLSEFGSIDPNIGFKFNPLWTLDETALVAKRKTEMDNDCAAIDHGIIDPLEARTRLAADEDSPYAALDLGKEIAPPGQPEEDEMGLPPENEQGNIGENPDFESPPIEV